MTKPRYFALIPAAGAGTRMQAATPKQYLPLLGVPILRRTVEVFLASPQIAHTFVVTGADDASAAPLLELPGVSVLACGGSTRQQSVLNGLQRMRDSAGVPPGAQDWVLVHDAARPGLTPALIDRLIAGVGEDGVGGLLALPVVDTVKREERAGQPDGPPRARETLARDGLWLAQTPQMFRFEVLLEALTQVAGQAGITDEASAIEAQGLRPKLIEGHPRNLKVTLPRDLDSVELYLKQDGTPMSMQVNMPSSTPSSTPASTQASMPTGSPAGSPAAPPFRIGQGYDCHVLTAGRPLIIGGVTIAHPKGLLGHSDADVLLHAVTDALLGAAALGDIGRHFPDTDARFAGADSRVLLREAASRVLASGYRIANLDATIIAQAPKMAPHIAAMVAHIAADLALDANQVNIKAKTNEKLGFLGREEGIAAEAVALLVRM